MNTDQVIRVFNEIQAYYNSILFPKFRHADFDLLKEKFGQLQDLKDDLGHDDEYRKLINAMSQVIAKLQKFDNLSGKPEAEIWSNLSERGINKVVPVVLRKAWSKVASRMD